MGNPVATLLGRGTLYPPLSSLPSEASDSGARALGQSKGAPAKTPIANYRTDVATVHLAIPGAEEMADMPILGSMKGNMFGGSKMGVMPGKWLDLSLYTRQKPGGTDGNDMIPWSSSEVPEAGLGLMDYLSHAQIDQWLRDKVLLPATTQQCAIPSGVFANAGGAMLRGIAYGNELNLLHPPRPTDPKLLAA